MALNTLEINRIGDLAYQALRDAIFSGEFAQGARLNQAELARRLGVSRAPIRDALKRLEAEGLVKTLSRAARNLWDRSYRIRAMALRNEESVRQGLEQHRAMLAAFQARVSARAVAFAEEHDRSSIRHLRSGGRPSRMSADMGRPPRTWGASMSDSRTRRRPCMFRLTPKGAM